MRTIPFAFLLIFFLQNCTEHPKGANPAAPQNVSPVSRVDALDTSELSFLKKISAQNEFILLADSVKRYYIKEDPKTPVLNELKYPDSLLQQKGYVYMSLQYKGSISDVEVSYRYSMGQASTGYGSITGNDLTDYVHSFNSCGLTSCILTVFKNQSKVYEKETPNK